MGPRDCSECFAVVGGARLITARATRQACGMVDRRELENSPHGVGYPTHRGRKLRTKRVRIARRDCCDVHRGERGCSAPGPVHSALQARRVIRRAPQRQRNHRCNRADPSGVRNHRDPIPRSGSLPVAQNIAANAEVPLSSWPRHTLRNSPLLSPKPLVKTGEFPF